MIEPALNEIMKKVDCRYTLVAVISKRARQLVTKPREVDEEKRNFVSMAIDDVMHDRIEYIAGSDKDPE